MSALPRLDPLEAEQDGRDLRAFIAVDIPDPQEVATVLAVYYPELARALLSSVPCRTGSLYAREMVAVLRSCSIVDIRSHYLTAYGIKIRRILMVMKRRRRL